MFYLIQAPKKDAKGSKAPAKAPKKKEGGSGGGKAKKKVNKFESFKESANYLVEL